MIQIKEAQHISQETFRELSFKERIQVIYDHYSPEDILVTSSFGIDASVFLHLIKEVSPDQPIHFINTGYLFNETLVYRDYLTSLWDLNVVSKEPEPFQHFKTELFQRWKSDPDSCCHINKVEVLMPLLWKHKVWISGLKGYQNSYRQGLDMVVESEQLLKFYPLIDMSQDDFLSYKLMHALPEHPLANKGYASVGCTHCTAKSQDRNGRWPGASKTECGIHRV